MISEIIQNDRKPSASYLTLKFDSMNHSIRVLESEMKAVIYAQENKINMKVEKSYEMIDKLQKSMNSSSIKSNGDFNTLNTKISQISKKITSDHDEIKNSTTLSIETLNQNLLGQHNTLLKNYDQLGKETAKIRTEIMEKFNETKSSIENVKVDMSVELKNQTSQMSKNTEFQIEKLNEKFESVKMDISNKLNENSNSIENVKTETLKVAGQIKLVSEQTEKFRDDIDGMKEDMKFLKDLSNALKDAINEKVLAGNDCSK